MGTVKKKKRTVKTKPTVQITTVRYGRLFNTGNYENERFEVEASVPPGGNAGEVMVELQKWVAAHAEGINTLRKFINQPPLEQPQP